jgi:hypothetical protein
MSLVARIALGIAVLAVLAVGGVIFYVLPKLGGAPGEETPVTTAAAPANPAAPDSSSASSAPAPAPAPVQTAEAPPPAPAPATPPAAPPPAASPAPPPPAPSPASETPAPVAVNTVPPAPTPALPEPSPAPSSAATGSGAPIPLTPAAPAPASPTPVAANPAPAVAAAPFNPAEPGADNISDRVDRTMNMAGTADARAAPLAAAPVLTRLEAGTPVMVVGVLAGHLWLEVQLADQRTAYVPAAALPGAVSSAPTMTASAPPPPAPMPSPSGGTPVGPAPAPAEAPALLNTSEDLTTTGPTPVYGGPGADGPVLRTLRPSTAVHIVAKTADGRWGWVQTPGGEQSFVQMSLLSAAPVLPESIAGRATVVNTGTLIVNGQRVQLFGLRGEGGAYAEQMRAQLDSQGGLVTCHRQDTQYICALPGGVDLGRMVLYNGAARPAPNASVDYQQQTAAARAAGRGVWGR